MALTVLTSDPRGLFEEMRRDSLRDDSPWTCDKDGDFTVREAQWRYRAWMRPQVNSDSIVFNVIAPTGQHLSSAAYAVYHSRMIDYLLRRFDTRFTVARATAMPTGNDIIVT